MIEAMPNSKRVARSDTDPLVHANNCLYPETSAEEAPRAADWVENSEVRLRIGEEKAHDLESFFADPSISRRSDDPTGIATCGAVIMTPAERRFDAVWGVPGDHPWQTFQL